MAGLLIIAHAPLASSLKAVAQHVYPECVVPLEAVDVSSQMQPEEIEARAAAALAVVRDPEALILTDVFGATPCNVAQRLADSPQVKVITGVNVPMLWRSLCYAAEPLDALVARAVAGATQGIMSAAPARPQNQASRPPTDDQDQRHDQQ
jgi:PTS system ascorbate-specific IIA component